jgi:hypothetical protein
MSPLTCFGRVSVANAVFRVGGAGGPKGQGRTA